MDAISKLTEVAGEKKKKKKDKRKKATTKSRKTVNGEDKS
jgi:hypothetical protein